MNFRISLSDVVRLFRRPRHKRAMSEVFRIGAMKRMKRGIQVGLMPSLECNYRCSYCSRWFDGKYAQASNLRSLPEWQKFLRDLESVLPIKGYVLHGGEPTLVSYFPELANWILRRGRFLTIDTNLSDIKPLLLIRQSPRLRIVAAYHHGFARHDFADAWKRIDGVHRVDAVELGMRRLEGGHKRTELRPFISPHDLVHTPGKLTVNPDFGMTIHCIDVVNAAWANAERQIGDSNV